MRTKKDVRFRRVVAPVLAFLVTSLFLILLDWDTVPGSLEHARMLSDSVKGVREISRLGSQFHLTISVITFNRARPLKRLLDSLVAAKYDGDEVSLCINIEAGAPEDVHRVAEDTRWPHGRKSVRARVIPSGLIPAVVESWYPSDDSEYGLLLEDDIEVSPYFYTWVRAGVEKLQSSAILPRVFGISLYTPRVVETTDPYRHYRPDVELAQFRDARAYLHQLPCSWGAVQFPKPWTLFHRYMQHRLEANTSYMLVSDSKTNGWKKSWKKFFIEMAWAKGMFMLYPNFFNQTSFSTNHLEAGVHINLKDTSHSPMNYTVPLKVDDVKGDLWKGTLPALDVFNNQYNQDESKILQVNYLPCHSTGPGFTGSSLASDPTNRHEPYGNKMESGHQLLKGSRLVSSPQRMPPFEGHFFVASHEDGTFRIKLFDPSSRFIKEVFTAGKYALSPWVYSLKLLNGSLHLSPIGCSANFDSDMCRPTWQIEFSSPSPQVTLHLQADGNLVILSGCGCSNQVLWQTSSAVPGYHASHISCPGGSSHRQRALLPGKPLRFSNSLVSEADATGHYVEAVIDLDGSLSIRSADLSSQLYKISPDFPGKLFYLIFALHVTVDGNVVFVAKKDAHAKPRVIWESGFHGNSNVSHFLTLDTLGNLVAFEGYGPCDLGRRVWCNAHHQRPPACSISTCPGADEEQRARLCDQESFDVYDFFSDPSSLTVILSTAGALERSSLISKNIAYMSRSPHVSCILVVWHKPFEPFPPSSILNGKVVRHLLTATDSLNNRFYPSLHITTSAVLVLDDDITIHYDDIHLLLSAWQLFMDKIVGFFPRWYSRSGGKDTYMFASENFVDDGYPMMLTKAMVLHKNYLHHYSCGMGRALHKIVDANTNCEDLAMNFVVSKLSHSPSSLYVQPFHPIGDYGKYMPGSLQKRGNHQNVRTDCLRSFESMLGLRLPFQKRAVYGIKVGSLVQPAINISYSGVGRHHVDCSPNTTQSDGCFLFGLS